MRREDSLFFPRFRSPGLFLPKPRDLWSHFTLEDGEVAQWIVAAQPRHRFLWRVIEEVAKNIYLLNRQSRAARGVRRADHQGEQLYLDTGYVFDELPVVNSNPPAKMRILALTGPIALTNAISREANSICGTGTTTAQNKKCSRLGFLDDLAGPLPIRGQESRSRPLPFTAKNSVWGVYGFVYLAARNATTQKYLDPREVWCSSAVYSETRGRVLSAKGAGAREHCLKGRGGYEESRDPGDLVSGRVEEEAIM